ncbi:MAG TPA: TetR/AcrR family transcriptional regulator [Spirochaetota bacterium]|nr:TetR/AcrR family transcriptional regulator [Spirochaetota bacterium]HPR49920.1 TetR/AcrR family transcriptional regulator [Spirochaetota bacterium]
MNREKKLTILKTAEKLFNRFGIKKTAVDDIAALARVAKGTIYNNFGSKEGVIHELIQEKINAFEKKLETTLQGIKDPVEELKVVLSERIKIILNSPFLCDRLLSVDELTLHSLTDELDRRLRQVIGRILAKDLPVVLAAAEQSKILNALIYFLRGMEQSMRDALPGIDTEKIEQELDYLIRRMVPQSDVK